MRAKITRHNFLPPRLFFFHRLRAIYPSEIRLPKQGFVLSTGTRMKFCLFLTSSLVQAASALHLSLTELRVACSGSLAEELSGTLFEIGAVSVDASGTSAKHAPTTIKDYDVFVDSPWISSGYWSQCVVRALVPSSLEFGIVRQIEELFPQAACERRSLDAQTDWLGEQQRQRPPVRFGNMTIVFPWHESTQNDLKIEGGTAFGTGEHPTTRLCCSWLQRETSGARILDYGTGSGILALVALKYGGAREAVGVDIDLDALLAARRNAESNGLELDCYVPTGYETIPTIETLPSTLPPFDVVVANLLLNPLVHLREDLSTLISRDSGVLAVSGIQRRDFAVFEKAYADLFEDVNIAAAEPGLPTGAGDDDDSDDDDWILVVCSKRISR